MLHQKLQESFRTLNVSRHKETKLSNGLASQDNQWLVPQLKIEKSAVEELNNGNVIADSKWPKMIKAVNLH